MNLVVEMIPRFEKLTPQMSVDPLGEVSGVAAWMPPRLRQACEILRSALG